MDLSNIRKPEKRAVSWLSFESKKKFNQNYNFNICKVKQKYKLNRFSQREILKIWKILNLKNSFITSITLWDKCYITVVQNATYKCYNIQIGNSITQTSIGHFRYKVVLFLVEICDSIVVIPGNVLFWMMLSESQKYSYFLTQSISMYE